MASPKTTDAPVRRRRRAPMLMAWVFAVLAAGVFGLFIFQASKVDTADQRVRAAADTAKAAKEQPGSADTGSAEVQNSAVLPQFDETKKVAVRGSEVSGFDKDNQPYTLTAGNAVQDETDSKLVIMDDVAGKLKRTDGRVMDVLAARGRFDTKQSSLNLSGDVIIRLQDTFTAGMPSAEVDVKQQNLTSSDAVVVNLQGGTITSRGLEVFENGARILFKSRVRAEFSEAAEEPVQSDAGRSTVTGSAGKGDLQE